MKLDRLLLPVVLVLAVLFVSYPATPQPAKEVVVLSPRPSSIINLLTGGQGNCAVGRQFVQIFQDGSQGSFYVVPENKVLVITSLQWTVDQFPSAGGTVDPVLFKQSPTGLLVALQLTGVADAVTGRAGGDATFPTGITLGPGGELCFFGPPLDGIEVFATAQGYLADNL